MSMNFFAFFPALDNPSINPQRRRHRILCEPRGSNRGAIHGSWRPRYFDRLVFEETGRKRGSSWSGSSATNAAEMG